MKRLFFLIIVVALIAAFAAFPARADSQITTSQPTSQMRTQDIRNAEKTDMSLGDCPVWAQVLVVGVIGLFGLLAVVPWLVSQEDQQK